MFYLYQQQTNPHRKAKERKKKPVIRAHKLGCNHGREKYKLYHGAQKRPPLTTIMIIIIKIIIIIIIIIIIVRGALFFLCRGTKIYNSFWGAPEFQDTYHGFVYFLTFSIFLKWILMLLVREKHRKTLYRLLLAKIKDGIRTTGMKTLNMTNK